MKGRRREREKKKGGRQQREKVRRVSEEEVTETSVSATLPTQSNKLDSREASPFAAASFAPADDKRGEKRKEKRTEQRDTQRQIASQQLLSSSSASRPPVFTPSRDCVCV